MTRDFRSNWQIKNPRKTPLFFPRRVAPFAALRHPLALIRQRSPAPPAAKPPRINPSINPRNPPPSRGAANSPTRLERSRDGGGARREAARSGCRRRRRGRGEQEGEPVRGVRRAAMEVSVPRVLPPHLQPPLRPITQAPHRLHRQAPPHRPRPALQLRRPPAPLR